MSHFHQRDYVQPDEFFKSHCYYCQRLDLMDMLNDAVTIVHAQSGMIIFMNEKACNLYGYSAEEYNRLHVTELAEDSAEAVLKQLALVKESGENGLEYTSHHRKKSGEMVTVEVNSRSLLLHGTPIYASIIRDLTPTMQVQGEVQLASIIQRGFLPADCHHPLFSVATLYYPSNIVSGDLFDYKWQQEKNCISGYIIDIMGHGVATALQASALRVLFHQMLDSEMSLTDRLRWINSQTMHYFAEDAFAAALLFNINLETGAVTCASAGINYFMISNGTEVEVVSAPGCFLGITPTADFDEITLTCGSGYSLCFLTDGLMDLIPEDRGLIPGRFDEMVDYLVVRAVGEKRYDDASALCLLIK